MLIAGIVAALALSGAACSNVTKQKKNVSAGGGGGKAQSTHWDEADALIECILGDLFGTTKPAPNFGRQAARHPLSLSSVARVSFGHEWNGGGILEFMGGARLTNREQFKYPIYGEVQAGWIHYSGFETDFTIRPAAGIQFPLKNNKYQFYVQGGLPIIFFGFFREHGVEWRAGITVPLPTKTP